MPRKNSIVKIVEAEDGRIIKVVERLWPDDNELESYNSLEESILVEYDCGYPKHSTIRYGQTELETEPTLD